MRLLEHHIELVTGLIKNNPGLKPEEITQRWLDGLRIHKYEGRYYRLDNQDNRERSDV